MAADLTALLRGSLLAALSALSAEGELTVLLLDDVTRRVLSRCCRLSDVMGEASITLVEQLHAPPAQRAPPGMAASLNVIYFVAPSERSVIALVSDLAGRRPLYGGKRHVLLTSTMPRHLRETLQALIHQGALTSFRECAAVEALALQARSFSLDSPSALGRLYGPVMEDAHLLPGLDEGIEMPRTAAVAHIAEQIGKLCALMGDVTPSVRCRTRGHPIAKEVGWALVSLSLTPAKVEGVGMSAGGLKRNVSVLILERSFDLLTPLMHDFSVEALAEATGVINEGRFRRDTAIAKRRASSGDTGAHTLVSDDEPASAATPSEVLLVSSDSLWDELRFCKVDEMEERLHERTRAFVTENEIVNEARRRLAQGEKLSTREMIEVNRRLASVAYRRREESLRVADELREALMSLLLPADNVYPTQQPASKTPRRQETPLYRLMMLEQDLATGRDALSGYPLKPTEAAARLLEQMRQSPASWRVAPRASPGASAAAATVSPKFNYPTSAIDSTDGAEIEAQRLLLLQALTLPLSDAARMPLLSASGLDADAIESVSRSLFCVGARPGRRGTLGAPKSAAPAGTTILARHTPSLREVLRSALTPPPPQSAAGNTTTGAGGASPFLWLRRRVHEPGDVTDKGAITGQATARPVGSWALRSRAGAEKRGKPVLLVFILGGASFAEVRCAHEIAEEYSGYDVIFGSSAVQTPTQFARSLVETNPMPPLALPVTDEW